MSGWRPRASSSSSTASAMTARHDPLAVADGTDVEILDVVDDYSRLMLAADACRTVESQRYGGSF